MPESLSQPDPNLPPPRRPLSCGRVVLGCSGTLVLFLLLGVLCFWLYFRSRDQRALRDVRDEIDRIHAAGEPITADDMVQFHRVPEGTRDTTELWLKAAKLAETAASPDQLLKDSRDLNAEDANADGSSEIWQAIERYLAESQSAVDAGFAAANANGQARFPMDWQKGHSSELEHIQGLIRLVRIYSLRHRLAVARGRPEDADQSLNAILAIAASLEYEANLVGQLVRHTVLHAYCAELTISLERRAFSDLQLETIQTAIAQLDFHQGLKLCLLGERVGGFVAFDDPATLQDNLENAADLPRGIDGTLGRPADCSFYLRTMREFLKAAELPLVQGRARTLDLEAKLEDVVYRGPIWQRMYKRFSAELTAGVAWVSNGFARAQSRRDCVVSAIAIRRYHLKHGKLPETLEALVPEFLPAVPRDLFASGNSPLRLVVEDGVVTVYSLGLDGVDDSGVEVESDGTTGDIAIAVRIEDLQTER